MKHNYLLKSMLLFSSVLVVGSLGIKIADAADKDEKKVEAEFEIIKNPNGSIKVEAENLQFGSHSVSPSDIIAKSTKNTSIKVIEFSGERPGWTLQVQMKQFTDKDDATKVAKDIKLFYPKVTPKTTSLGEVPGNPPVSKGTDTSFEDSIPGVIVSDDNTPVTIAEAVKGKGFGDWELSYNHTDKSLIQIKIPTGQKIGKYKTELLYTAAALP